MLFQGNTLNVFHNDVFSAVCENSIIYLNDIGVGQKRKCGGFIDEKAHLTSVMFKLFAHHFNCNRTSRYLVISTVNGSHTSNADNVNYRVSLFKGLTYKAIVSCHFATSSLVDRRMADILSSPPASLASFMYVKTFSSILSCDIATFLRFSLETSP